MIPFWKKTDKGGKKTPPKPAIPHTAQQSIPMQRMFEDGTCRVRANYYTRTIAYQDINYQLAQQEDKNAIFEEWCSFLNFFDSSIKFELSFVNMATDSSEFEKSIRIPFQKDGFDDVRAEYSLMLRQQLAKGNNGLTKTKFITFGVEGESMRQVKTRLDHVQNDLLNNFHRLGVQAKPLNGTERLKLMHDMFHMDGESKFRFEWNDLVKSGLSVKDAIAPTAFAFKNSRTFQMGGIYCAASFLSITASDISDQLLKDFLDMDSSQIVTMHIQSVDQNRAIKTVKRTITELDRSKIEEQKKAIRAGYDIDIIPSDLATYGRDAKALLKELQSQNERMFLVTFLVLNTGRTEQKLENNVFQASSIAQKHNCNLCRLDYQQEQGLMSSLPLADNQIEIQRGLTTSSTAIFIPFTTQELYQSGKESLYYGLNALSNNLIIKKFGALLVSAVLCIGMAAPAFAYEGDTTPVEEPVLPEIVEEEDAVTITDEETGALTPEGNLTLVDDYHTNYSDGSGQQFITMVSKSGATFYLVIDRNAKGQQTVHFMNLVDEADLLALMEEEAAEAYNAEKEAAKQAELDKLKAEEEAKKAAEEAAASDAEQPKENKVTKYAAAFLGVVALIALVAGGGFYFFIQQKHKKQAEKEAADPDADYTEDNGNFEIPPEDDSDDEDTSEEQDVTPI